MSTKYLPVRPVATRYGVSDRTIDRWVDAGDIPAPVYIQGRRYWSEEQLDQHDAARATKQVEAA